MTNIIDSLFLEIGIKDKLSSDGAKIIAFLERFEKELFGLQNTVEETQDTFDEMQDKVGKTVEPLKKVEKELKNNEKQIKKNNTQAKSLLEVLTKTGKQLGAIGTIFASTTALKRLAMQSADVNVGLNNLSKNIGVAYDSLVNWSGAAEMAGGSANGMLSTIKGLSSGLTRFAVMGDDSIIKFFTTLDIMPFETNGKIKDLNALLLELADRFSVMETTKAFSIAQSMGIDEDTFNLLKQGRNEVQKFLLQQSSMYRSKQKDIEVSRRLVKSTKTINQQFEAMKLMIGNAAAPALLTISEIIEKLFNFLMKHEGLIQGFFLSLSGILTTVLIPTLWRATAATFAFIAPYSTMILVILGLAAAFGLLFDDYQTWAEGGDSLFNWGVFIGYINGTEFSLKNLGKAFNRLKEYYTDWEKKVENGKAWLTAKGFIEDNKITVESLINGFSNLAQEIYISVLPALGKIGDIVNALKEGRFSDAFAIANEAIYSTAKWAQNKINPFYSLFELKSDKNFYTVAKSVKWMNGKLNPFYIEGLKPFIDDLTGHDPNSPNSLTQMDIYNREGATGKPRTIKSGFTGFGADIDSYIKEAAEMWNVDEKTLRGLIKMESGWTGKDSPTGAIGVGQFTTRTWNELANSADGKRIGMQLVTEENKGTSNDPRRNNRVNTLATALYVRNNRKQLLNAGIEITPANIYMAHNIGASGLRKALSGNADSSLIDIMRKNGMKEGMTPAEFLTYQKGRFQTHYDMANNVNNVAPVPEINRNNYAISAAMRATEFVNNAMGYSGPQNIQHNRHTEVVINGGLNVQSSASTISGTSKDAVNAIQQHIDVMAFNNGLH
ncbi:transglycosylase-like protein with SLT domain [Volucribacter psittacicida]|uniref:Transglycosylase-like protein with SLT domain n=1 Tax=Volucribacter psittacicida TaxID=203482 RepID=A0A4R1FRF5_9PAST|nr:transglycosylase SLT domain-containing protein [Volucribacter psittacicida]TCJ96142.1 transglycosylase-like protein with SLT domain [Volucribacter psittacicida]